MAKVEALGAEKRWQAQRLANVLDVEIRELNVALNELGTVKPKKATYRKQANVFFLGRRDAIIKAKRNELKEKEAKRHEMGLQLRKEPDSK